jgi:type I restriction enzyme S subunit
VTEQETHISPQPNGWVWTTLGQISATTSGGTPLRKHPEYFGGTIPWLKSGELNNGLITNFEETITEEGLNNSSSKIIPSGTLLIALYGATTGKLGILGIDAAINQAICAITVPEELNKRYVFHYLSFYRDTLLNSRKGGAQPNISQQIVNEIAFPLPPFPEQHRIVAKIEKLFSRLDDGVETLKKVQLQLKRYRLSVLKSAFDGTLTAEWRETHKAELEPASILLQKIKEERKKRGNYKELSFSDTTDLTELPEEWEWTRIGDISDVNPRVVSEFPESFEVSFIPMRSIEAMTGKVDLSIIKPYEEVRKGFTHFLSGDLLFAKITPCMENGKVAVVSNLKNGVGFGSTEFHVIRPFGKIPSKLIFFYVLQESFRKDARQQMTGTAGQLRVPSRYLSEAVFPFPPLPEQQIIVGEIERYLSVVDETETMVEQSLKQSERLRQSILKKAFEGKLIPQDPDDEPADKLLERIKIERTKMSIKQGKTAYGK